MKKIVYIILFIILGSLLQLLVHAVIESIYIRLLIVDFDTYSLGWSWADWYLIHDVGTFILLVAGMVLGWWQGKYWWRRIYEKKK